MDLGAALRRDRTKANIERIVAYVGHDAIRFEALMHLVRTSDQRTAQLASWPMTMICEANPQLGSPWVADMLDLLERPAHPGIHRNIVRSLKFCPLPVKFHGRITNLMFALIGAVDKPIGQRAFTITVAMRMADRYPALEIELKLILADVLRVDPGPAIRSRATKALRMLA